MLSCNQLRTATWIKSFLKLSRLSQKEKGQFVSVYESKSNIITVSRGLREEQEEQSKVSVSKWEMSHQMLQM